MRAYKLLLKALAVIILVPLCIFITGLLGYVGFMIDFSKYGENTSYSGSGVVYMLILPLMFISTVAWLGYVMHKRSSSKKKSATEANIRQQVYREQQLGTNPQEIIVNTLIQGGDKTAQELARVLNMDEEKVQLLLGELIRSRQISQDTTQRPLRFYVER